MEKEFVKSIVKSVTLNVTAGKIDSFRQTEKTTGTVRVYENGCIGVAGCLGEPNEEELTARAREALAFGIPYPEKLEGELEMEVLNDREIIPIPEFIPTMQRLLDRLGEECPKFALSNKISIESTYKEYRNSKGRRLKSSGSCMNIGLVAQSRGSGNLFDTGLFWSGTDYDEEKVLAEFKREYEAFYTPADIEPGRYPVVLGSEVILYRFFRHFFAELYAAGASLLSGKLNEKVFSEKLTMKDDMNPATAFGACFFDAEGCVAPDMRPSIVENGVLKGVLTTKKTAAAYGLPNLGTADAAYDGVPGADVHALYAEKTAGSLKELVPGKAILVMVAEGGDATPDGHYVTPVQMAYLMENGELAGRLPDISISGDFFDIFGRDYIGSVHNEPFEGAILSAFEMNADKA